jgi:hypothetical protein
MIWDGVKLFFALVLFAAGFAGSLPFGLFGLNSTTLVSASIFLFSLEGMFDLFLF